MTDEPRHPWPMASRTGEAAGTCWSVWGARREDRPKTEKAVEEARRGLSILSVFRARRWQGGSCQGGFWFGGSWQGGSFPGRAAHGQKTRNARVSPGNREDPGVGRNVTRIRRTIRGVMAAAGLEPARKRIPNPYVTTPYQAWIRSGGIVVGCVTPGSPERSLFSVHPPTAAVTQDPHPSPLAWSRIVYPEGDLGLARTRAVAVLVLGIFSLTPLTPGLASGGRYVARRAKGLPTSVSP